MKVYMVGSHSCGKTTLASYVSEKYDLPMITEVARAILSEKELHLDTLRYDMDVVDDYQENVLKRQFIEENKLQNFVSDRSFDCLAYMAQHSRILSKYIGDSCDMDLSKYINKLREDDSFIFFVRPSKATLKADGVREDLNWDGIVSIDAMIKMLLQMFQLRYFQIETDNMQERVQFIDAVLSLNKSC